MADLRSFVCPVAAEVHTKMHEGLAHREEARRIAIRELEAGTASVPLQKLIAKMLKPVPPDGKRGPKAGFPNDWSKILCAWEEMRSNGTRDIDARESLAEEYGRSRREIDRAISFGRKAKDEDTRLG